MAQKRIELEGGGVILVDRGRITHKEAKKSMVFKIRVDAAAAAGDADALEALMDEGDRLIERVIVGISAKLLPPHLGGVDPTREIGTGKASVSPDAPVTGLPAGWLDEVPQDMYEQIVAAAQDNKQGN